MKLSGKSIIGSRTGEAGGPVFHATNPTNGERMEPGFHAATSDEINKAVTLADQAFQNYSRVPGRDKATFLRKIAGNIEANATEIIERAEQETALPKGRLQGETARTCGQLRLFAQVVEEGSWVMARLDRPNPDRKRLPSLIFDQCCAPWDRWWFLEPAISRWLFQSRAVTRHRRSPVGIPLSLRRIPRILAPASLLVTRSARRFGSVIYLKASFRFCSAVARMSVLL